MEEQDVAKTLSELVGQDLDDYVTEAGADDYVTKVMELYQRSMEVFEDAERIYLAALGAGSAVNDYSTSTNL